MTADPITAACRRDYLPAFHDSGGRSIHDLIWTIVHDEEAPTAQAAAEYFQHPDSGGSATICVDQNRCYRTLPNDAIPWGARSAPELEANLHGFHIEQAGYAAWTLGKWRIHSKTIDRAAFKIAQNVPHLPVVWLEVDALVRGGRSGKLPRGITSHRNITAASKILDPAHAWRYDHTDPGRFYPSGLLIARTKHWRGVLESA